MTGSANAPAVESILRAWLTDADLSLFCGHWGQGGLMELLPRGGARLSGPRYAVPFDGVRELRLHDSAHHVHLDLRRLTHAWYVMVPSVCHGFRPSFELRLTAADCDPRDSFGLGLALGQPYAGRTVRSEPVRRYFRRAAAHLEMYPGAVSFMCERPADSHGLQTEWARIESLLSDVGRASDGAMNRLRAGLRCPGPAAPGT